MKKKMLLVLSLAACMAFVSCGQKGTTTTESPKTETPTAQPTTETPTEAPTTAAPTEAPATEAPATEAPTEAPTETPTEEPTSEPEPVEKVYAFTGADIVEEDGKAIVVYTGTYSGYTANEIMGLDWHYDFQKNPYAVTGDWSGDWSRVSKDTGAEFAAEDGVFTVKFDVTNFEQFKYTAHMGVGVNTSGDNTGEALDFKLDEAIDKTIKVGSTKYELISVPGSSDGASFWGAVGLAVIDASQPVYKIASATVKADGDKAYLVFKGTSENYTAETLAAAAKFNLQHNDNIDGQGWDSILTDAVPTVTMDEEGNYEAAYDITSADIGAYTNHFSVGTESAGDVKLAESYDEKVNVGYKSYEVKIVAGSSEGTDFWGCVGVIVSAYDPYHINFEEQAEGTIANGTKIGAFETVSTDDKPLTIAAAAEGVTVGETTYTNYLKTAGASSTSAGKEYRLLKFTTTGRGKVTVVARTGSAGGSERSIYAYNVENGVQHDSAVVDEAGTYELTLHYGGTFYLGTSNNIQIFDVKVEYEDGVNDEWEPPIELDDALQLNANNLPCKTYTSNVEFDNFVINAGASEDKKDVTVDTSNKSYDGVSYTQRIKLGGSGTYEYRSVDIKVTAAARITVVCLSSNSSTATEAKLFDKSLAMDAEGAQVGDTAAIATTIGAYVFTVEAAGTYCFVGTGSKGVNICNIIIEYAE